MTTEVSKGVLELNSGLDVKIVVSGTWAEPTNQ